jgi:hypothetical protein
MIIAKVKGVTKKIELLIPLSFRIYIGGFVKLIIYRESTSFHVNLNLAVLSYFLFSGL